MKLLINNKTFYTFISIVLLLALILPSALLLTGCGGNEDSNSADSTDGKTNYTVTVISDTGAVIENVTVYVYSDSALEDLVAVEKTNADGVMSFSCASSDTYTAVLDGVPAGYSKENSYAIKGAETTITLVTVLPTDKDRTYGKGDLMYNFDFTDIEGNTHKLSELIKTKKAVVLNFWFINCGPCASEFPYLNEAYEMYSDSIEVIAVNPVDESADNVKSYAAEKQLSMPVVSENIEWQDMMKISGYPTTVVIDRHGKICLVHTGAITSTEEFTKIFDYFTADSYKQTVLDGIDDIPADTEDISADEGGNPTEVGGVTEFEMTVEPGKTEYCDVYKISKMMLTVESENAVIEYNGDKYTAENGVVSVYVVAEDTFTPIRIGVGNTGNDTETFKIVFTAPLGSSSNPYTAVIGEFTTEIAEGNDQGIYYKYVAEENGTLTVECIKSDSGIDYDYVLYNLDSYAQRSLKADGAEGDKSISVDVKKGETVTLTIGALPDSSNNYPACTFTSLLSFAKGEGGDNSVDITLNEYSVTVKDANGKAIKGVNVKFTSESETVTLTTDADGYASTWLADNSCKAVITVPNGYTAEKTEYELTADSTVATVTLTEKVIVMAEYTVTVKDSNGAAVKDVLVTVGDNFVRTGADGKASFNLPADNYTAAVSLPNGYTANKTSFELTPTKKTVSVTLTKSNSQGGGTANSLSYSVTVKKADGIAVSNVAVVFEKDGASASVQTTDNNGKATANLEKGTYKVKLAFANGVKLNYDKSSASLTASKSSITITVAEPVSDEVTELYVGMAHHLSLGGNYCTLDSTEDVTYFVFNPERDGVYSFTTSYSGTVISYWGANTNFIYDQTDATDCKNNLFTLTIKESNLGASYIIGVKGGDDAVVIVKRTGNPPKTIEDMPWTVYTPQKSPVAFNAGIASENGFTANFFNVCGKTADYKLIYNSADGYYHLGTKDGSIVYVMLGKNAPHVSFSELVSKTGLKNYFYNANGECYKKEDYTECMTAFAEKMDDVTGLYPLNDDLIYMIKQGGEGAGWWDSTAATYLFTDLNGVNPELMWMFALCTVTTK